MSERCVGMVVEGETVWIVDADVPEDPQLPVDILADNKWDLQDGDRATALAVMSRRCASHIKENKVVCAFVMASGAPLGRARVEPLLKSAELRGVVMAAAAQQTAVKMVLKKTVSRTFGDRKFDEYCKDDAFWKAHTTGKALRKTSRPAAMVVVAGRE